MDTQSTDSQPTASLAAETSSPKSANTGMAILAYLGVLLIVPFLTDAKDDPYVKFHLHQGLVLLICEIVAWFVAAIPFFGWVLAPILWLFVLIMVIIGIVNAAAGHKKELPLIGKYARSFKF